MHARNIAFGPLSLLALLAPAYAYGCEGTMRTVDDVSPDGAIEADAADTAVADGASVTARDGGAGGHGGDGDASTSGDDGGTPPAIDASAPIGDMSRCGAATGLLLCEGFEGPLDARLWTVVEDHGGVVRVDADRAARGLSALHVHAAPSGGSRATITETRTFATPHDTLFVRAFVYTTSPLPEGHDDLFSVTGTDDRYQIALAIGGDQFKPLYHDPASEYSVWPETSPAFPTDRWACIEWQIDEARHQVRTFVDDVEVTEIAVTGSERPVWTIPEAASLTLGVFLFHDETATSSAGFDFFIDELAVSETRVGCAR